MGRSRGSARSTSGRSRSARRSSARASPPSRSSTRSWATSSRRGRARSRRGRPRSRRASPRRSPAITVNKVCLSGMSAIAIADQMIRAGELEIVVAGGMESMTNAPFLLPKARDGSRLGDTPMVDSHDPRRPVVRASTTGTWGRAPTRSAPSSAITREDQDAWAARSHARAARGLGRRAGSTSEVVAVEVPQRQGRPGRPSTATRASGRTRPSRRSPRLRPAFTPEGTVTAGNASQISDGAAAVVVMSEEVAGALGLEPLAEIVAYGMSADRVPVPADGAGARDAGSG